MVVGVCAGFAAAGRPVTAQNVAYRQSNLASDIRTTGFADHANASIRDPWGLTFIPRLALFVGNRQSGRVATVDAHGQSVAPSAFDVPNAGGPGSGAITGIVADTTLAFAARDTNQFVSAVIIATADGGLDLWGVDAQGNKPTAAFLKANHAQTGAVYTSLAILTPTGGATMLAVADFHNATVQLFDTAFAAQGTLRDPNLPPGFAPFGMQVVGAQLFVTFAPQDAAKLNPVAGAGNGLISVFDLRGNFVRRFVTSGPLNAPWGITQAGSDFGPFGKAILVANAGDGVINAFDAASGNFLGALPDGDGNPIRNSGMHGLMFGSSALGDANTLYFTAGINNGQDGLLGAITTGLISVTRVNAPPPVLNVSDQISITVAAGPGNTGVPTGSVSVSDGDALLKELPLTGGAATLDNIFTTSGTHTLHVRYSGDATFLPSSSQMDLVVSGPATSVTVNAPATAAAGEAIAVTAAVHSDAGIPTGQVDFHDGNTSLGSALLNDAGEAVLRTNTLTSGRHSLTAIYEGDAKFSGSTSTAVTISIVAADFSVASDRAAATVTAGQSTQFMLTATPSDGFADNVTFSCAAVAGISCS
ncbi:MAG TPA: TIGR03118 family protein, partial [Candidatus Acidoferrum sp.]|nr:TIGR03118 family protein [Candidatus Acidoferrum sp.]